MKRLKKRKKQRNFEHYAIVLINNHEHYNPKKNSFSTLISYDCIQRHIVILLHNSVQPKVGFDFRPIAVHLLIHDLTFLCEM